MSKPIDPERLTPDDGAVEHSPASEAEIEAGPGLERGAEPYWMQDIRLAARRVYAAREAARAERESAARPANPDQAAS